MGSRRSASGAVPPGRRQEIFAWISTLTATASGGIWMEAEAKEAATNLAGCGFEAVGHKLDATCAVQNGAISGLVAVLRQPTTGNDLAVRCWAALLALISCNPTSADIVVSEIGPLVVAAREHLCIRQEPMLQHKVQLFICRIVGVESVLPYLGDIAPLCSWVAEDHTAGDKMVQLATFSLLMIAQMARKRQDSQLRANLQRSLDLVVFADLSANASASECRKGFTEELVFELAGDNAKHPAMQKFLDRRMVETWLVPTLQTAIVFGVDGRGAHTPDIFEMLIVPATSGAVARRLIDAGVLSLCVQAVLLDEEHEGYDKESVATGRAAALESLCNMAGHVELFAEVQQRVWRPVVDGGLLEAFEPLLRNWSTAVRTAAARLAALRQHELADRRDRSLVVGSAMAVSTDQGRSRLAPLISTEVVSHRTCGSPRSCHRSQPSPAQSGSSRQSRLPRSSPNGSSSSPSPLSSTTHSHDGYADCDDQILWMTYAAERLKALRDKLFRISFASPRDGSRGVERYILHFVLVVSLIVNAVLLCRRGGTGSSVVLVSSPTLADADGDGIPDHHDFCSGVSPSAPDWRSGRVTDFDGDGCRDGVEDFDRDNDGVIDTHDTCPNTPQQYKFVSNAQSDFDGDGCADGVEDKDDDGDGVANAVDRCHETMSGEGQDHHGCSSRQLEIKKSAEVQNNAQTQEETQSWMSLLRGAWVEVLLAAVLTSFLSLGHRATVAAQRTLRNAVPHDSMRSLLRSRGSHVSTPVASHPSPGRAPGRSPMDFLARDPSVGSHSTYL